MVYLKRVRQQGISVITMPLGQGFISIRGHEPITGMLLPVAACMHNALDPKHVECFVDLNLQTWMCLTCSAPRQWIYS